MAFVLFLIIPSLIGFLIGFFVNPVITAMLAGISGTIVAVCWLILRCMPGRPPPGAIHLTVIGFAGPVFIVFIGIGWLFGGLDWDFSGTGSNWVSGLGTWLGSVLLR